MAAAGSSGGSNTGGIRAGRAYVEIFANDSQFRKSLDALRGSVSQWGGQLARLGGIGSLITFIKGGLTAAFAMFAKSSLDAAGALADVSARLGEPIEELNALAYAAELAGGSLEDVEGNLAKMQVAIANAKQVGDLNLGKLAGLELPEQIDRIADAIASIENPAQRTAFAVEIFGKSGRKMLPFLSEGSEGMARFREEAARVTGVTADQVDALDSLGDSFARIMMTIKSVGTSLTVAAFGDPAGLESVQQTLSAIAKGFREVVQNNGPLVQGMVLAAAGAAALTVSLGALGLAALAVSAGLGTIASIAAVIFSAKFLALSGIAVSLAAVIALIVKFTTVGDTFKGAWGGLMQAVKSGQLELAFKIVFASIKVEWFKLMKEMSSGAAAAAIIAAAGATGAAKGGIPGSIAAGSAAIAGLTTAKLEAEAGIAEAEKRLKELLSQVQQETKKAKTAVGAAGAAASGLGGPTRGGFGSAADLRRQFSVNDTNKPLNKIADNTERTAKATERLLDKPGAVWAA
jgi:hypothetical protein